MEIYDLSRNDVDGAVRLYGEKRAGAKAGPARQALLSQLIRLQDSPGTLAKALRAAYPADFPA